MSNYVVVVFPDEAKAYEGSRALKELHTEGSLGVYGMAVLGTDASGKLSVKQAADTGPIGTGVGALVGGLAGLLGGPVTTALGMNYGALIGGVSDLFNAGVGSDFIKAVAEKLSPGKTALVAEVDEDWVTPLNTRMEKLGGVVIRESRSDFEDGQIEKDVEARRVEYQQMVAEWDRAEQAQKAQLTAHMNDAREKLQAAGARAKGRQEQFERETNAKIKQLQDQAAKAKGEAKVAIDQKIGVMRADYTRRSQKLQQAWERTKEAVAG